MSKITRVEVVGPGGREYVGYYKEGVEARACLQDDRQTLKLFLDVPVDDGLYWDD